MQAEVDLSLHLESVEEVQKRSNVGGVKGRGSDPGRRR